MTLASHVFTLPLLNANDPLSPMVWQDRLLHSIFDESDGCYHSDPLSTPATKPVVLVDTACCRRK